MNGQQKMTQKLSTGAYIFVAVLLFSKDSFAYVDPGLAGILYQAGYAIVAAFVGYFAFFKSWFLKIGKKKSEKNSQP